MKRPPHLIDYDELWDKIAKGKYGNCGDCQSFGWSSKQEHTICGNDNAPGGRYCCPIKHDTPQCPEFKSDELRVEAMKEEAEK